MKNLVITRCNAAKAAGRHIEYRLLIIGFRSVHLVVGADDFGIVNIAIRRGLFVEKRIERDNGTQNNREGDERRHDNAYDNRGRLPLGLEAALLWAALLPTPSKFGGGGGAGTEDGAALPAGVLKGESWKEE